MLRRAANLVSPPSLEPGDAGSARRLGRKIRRSLRRITRSKSPANGSHARNGRSPSSTDDTIPQVLQEGVMLTKISANKQRTMLFRLDPTRGQLIWESKVTKYISIDAIRYVRAGPETKLYRDSLQVSDPDCEDRWITLIYMINSTNKTMHLLAPTKDIMDMWLAGLRKVHLLQTELMSGLTQGELLEVVWERHYWNGKGFNFDDVVRLCARLNGGWNEEEVQRLFQLSDSSSRGLLDIDDFSRFAKLLKARPDIARIYKRLVGARPCFDLGVFTEFMGVQHDSRLSPLPLEALFEAYADKSVLSVPCISLESFSAFLLSADNSCFADEPEKAQESRSSHHHYHHHHQPPPNTLGLMVESEPYDGISGTGTSHEMTRPLPEYFISSSHNTYLLGHQLVGQSTIEGYVRALQAGCRSVELDIFPGTPSPVVTHGNTLTTKIPLQLVCEAINQHAFETSPYPVIISAEIHCPVAQQEMIAQIMSDVFGDKLVQASIDSRPTFDELPSPHDLRGRILVKTKNIYISRDDPLGIDLPRDVSYTSADSTADDSELNGNESDNKRESRFFRKASDAIQRVRSSSRGQTSRRESSPSSSHSDSKPKMSQALLDLLVYTVGVKYRGINKKEAYAPQHMFSLSENAASRMVRSSAVLDLIKHTRTHLVRIYPKGMRVNSSNCLPHHFWSSGAQLVALNRQTVDLGSLINHAMFARNGGLGYVLKPRALRLPNQKELLNQKTEYVLEVTVVSAQQLAPPKDSASDLSVEVSLHLPDWTGFQTQRGSAPPSAASNPTSITMRTSSCKRNAFNPVWEEKLLLPFSCRGDMTELVFVRFAVKQDGNKDDDDPFAQYCTSLACLQQGYRHIPLHDTQLSQFLFSTLFVKVRLRRL
ncbi:unnamed protein product [Mycena citricolor]|uniref:Phosphoinositide phospholipase C n=1 Tax=Mycena citricolor TaxID=2018698 RepID=A0AAD2HB03_9AGAR|nr:unnamed protein product [Mycena citricolor]